MSIIDDFAALQASIITKLQEITSGELFDNPAGEEGKTRQLRFYEGGVPPKRADVSDEENYPFVAVRIVSGSGDLDVSMVQAQLICGLYTWSDMSAGQADSFRLLDLLLQVQEHRGFAAPFRLALPVKWHLGVDEGGRQPHPYYQVSVTVPFRYAPRATKTRG